MNQDAGNKMATTYKRWQLVLGAALVSVLGGVPSAALAQYWQAETVEREERVTVRRPVWETQEREERVVVRKPVTETIERLASVGPQRLYGITVDADRGIAYVAAQAPCELKRFDIVTGAFIAGVPLLRGVISVRKAPT